MTQTTRPRALLSGATTFRAAVAGPASAEIALYDEIGGYGITAAAFRDVLQKVSGARELKLRINSPGGDVFDSIAIYNMLARHPAPVTVSAFDAPARQAMIPNLVPRAELSNAFTLNTLLRQGSIIVGPSVGGLVVGSGLLVWETRMALRILRVETEFLLKHSPRKKR